jgi:hypothetical protein
MGVMVDMGATEAMEVTVVDMEATVDTDTVTMVMVNFN